MITKSQLLRKTMRFVSLSMAGALAAWFFLGVSNDSRSQTGLPDSVKDSVIYLSPRKSPFEETSATTQGLRKSLLYKVDDTLRGDNSHDL